MAVAEPYEFTLAPYATRATEGGMREHAEPADQIRSPFVLDRQRILASAAFRRLQGKTQVFFTGRGDHFRTRLTHTLEVAQWARCLARTLRANEDLCEAIALGHDLGHPPFGHAGECALNESLRDIGGFNHNVHSLRVVEFLEHPFPPFRGLNLTAATRAGLAEHSTRYDEPNISGSKLTSSADAIGSKPVEGQIVSLADRIAYNSHDLEDAIGVGLVTLRDLEQVELWQHAHAHTEARFGQLSLFEIRRVVLDVMVDRLLTDAIDASTQRLAAWESPDLNATNECPWIELSSVAEAMLGQIESFLMEKVYLHPRVAETDETGRSLVRELFEIFAHEPRHLPERFRVRVAAQGLERVIGDYLAGMTDRFCRRERQRLLGR